MKPFWRALFAVLTIGYAEAAEVKWSNLSSGRGELPLPGESTQQTGNLVADLDGDGVKDFVLAFRAKAPALVWYRHKNNAWSRQVIESDFLTVEAGGTAYDIDGDGDLDIVFGGDWQSKELWWWENPAPNFGERWKRHVIKKDGKTQHHDQVFGDFKGTGRAQLVFWNQGAKSLFVADIPKNPREVDGWKYEPVYSGEADERGDAGGGFKYAEGCAAADIDGDGVIDILAGNVWFKYHDGKFRRINVGVIGGRIAGAKLIEGSKFPQIVIAPGDGSGALRWYECTGNPTEPVDWKGHDLVNRAMIHGHTLDIGDVDGDGHLDIFAAEMAKWTESKTEPDNPKCEAWIFYGDGKGNFKQTTIAVGHGFHEGKLDDLNGDGRLDILNKPYNWKTPRIDVWLNGGANTTKSVPTRR